MSKTTITTLLGGRCTDINITKFSYYYSATIVGLIGSFIKDMTHKKAAAVTLCYIATSRIELLFCQST